MKTAEFTRWLFYEARFRTDFKGFIDAVCCKLVQLGIPVSRVRISFRTLHPQVLAWSATWDQESGADIVVIDKTILETEDYRGSPIEYVLNHKRQLRQDLEQIPDGAHPVFHELQAKGMTDYVANPVIFSTGAVNVATFATRCPDGFSDHCIAFLSELSTLCAPFIEILATRRLARNLLDTYIGPRTGRRILEGKIQRGDGENIDAAIWFSDFRNFTQYTETLPPQQVLDTLNRYFEIVHASVEQHGGEILRFIGDAMLIVFPVEVGTPVEQACLQALAAAREAQRAVIEQNRADSSRPRIEFGVGLHQGCVMYGNVGAPTRLDFTVMGIAVNRAARLESLTRKLDCPVLMSEQFNASVGNIGDHRGSFAVKGVAGRLNVFSLS